MRRASASTAWRRQCRGRFGSPAHRTNRCARRLPGWISEPHRCWHSVWFPPCARERRPDVRTDGRRRVAPHGTYLLLPDADRRRSPEDQSSADIEPQPDRGTIRHLQSKRRLDHRRRERRSAFPPRRKTDRRDRVAYRSALRQRQSAWRQWRDHQCTRRCMGRRTHQRRRHRAIRSRPRSRRPDLPPTRNTRRPACAAGRLLHRSRFSRHRQERPSPQRRSNSTERQAKCARVRPCSANTPIRCCANSATQWQRSTP